MRYALLVDGRVLPGRWSYLLDIPKNYFIEKGCSVFILDNSNHFYPITQWLRGVGIFASVGNPLTVDDYINKCIV